MDNKMYEVARRDYVSFIEQIIPGCAKIKEYDTNLCHITCLYSNKTGKKLCARHSFKDFSRKPEKYYIFNMPDDDERQNPIPKMRITLDNIKDVQTFFNILSKQSKEQDNGNIL